MIPSKLMRDLLLAAEEEGIHFISDEIYHGLDYAFAAETAAKLSDRAVVINSCSKYFCMTGWRIGWMVLPPDLVRSIERLQGNLAISVPSLSQIAALAAFDARAEMEAVKHGYEENRRILLTSLPQMGFQDILPVDGAFYLYADVSRFCSDSHEFAKRMLAQTHVAITPGLDFDPFNGKRFIRMSYSGGRGEIEEAMERLGAWLVR
jgi:aspartate/methionine/tyrosine aminotransferase